MLLLVASVLVIHDFIVLKLLLAGHAVPTILYCIIGLGLELYVHRNTSTVCISRLGLLSKKKN